MHVPAGETGGLRESMVQCHEAIARSWILLCEMGSRVVSSSLLLLAGEAPGWTRAAACGEAS